MGARDTASYQTEAVVAANGTQIAKVQPRTLATSRTSDSVRSQVTQRHQASAQHGAGAAVDGHIAAFQCMKGQERRAQEVASLVRGMAEPRDDFVSVGRR